MNITINKETLLIDGGDASPLSLSWQCGDPYRKAIFDALVVKYLALEADHTSLAITARGSQELVDHLEHENASLLARVSQLDVENAQLIEQESLQQASAGTGQPYVPVEPVGEPTEQPVIKVSNAQGRIILRRAGVFDLVINILNSISNEQEREEALLKFEHEPYIHSNNALVNLVLGESEIGLGYSEEQIGQLFLEGQGL